MNPSGLRIEEKKSADSSSLSPRSHNQYHSDAKSHTSYKSTHSSRSSVLERAREYNRRIDHQNRRGNASSERQEQRQRAKSLERGGLGGGDASSRASGASSSVASSSIRRSVSAGRMPRSRTTAAAQQMTTRERAMASVRKDATAGTAPAAATSTRQKTAAAGANDSLSSTENTHPLTPASTNYTASPGTTAHTNGSSNISPRPQQTPQPSQSSYLTPNHHTHDRQQRHQHATTATTRNTTSSSSNPSSGRQTKSAPAAKQQAQAQQQQARGGAAASSSRHRSTSNKPAPTESSSPGNRSLKSRATGGQQPGKDQQAQQQQGGGVVTPELLVDALSGHEDGLLAIAERLMEHYDSGYDVMGEAIIDAFADVQKLFQHVVEAAHMEGAAFEASRREEEMVELRRQAAAATSGDAIGGNEDDDAALMAAGVSPSGGPARHDEFIDQDVKDLLTEAIRKGTVLRDADKHAECLDAYERACSAASSLLPVDSDHRGRLQLSLARADSMSPERACAILRYSMDDVLRSGMRATRTPLPDLSKRADVVLSRNPRHGHQNGGGGGPLPPGVVQSSDEALASLVEEMKEILTAPVYNNTPLQAVSRRYWAALADAQKGQQKNEERLEQQLGKLKGDFLLAKAEWEEKLNKSNETADLIKEKYERLKESARSEQYLDQSQSRSFSRHEADDHNDMSLYGSVKSSASAGRAGSVASLGSGLAHQAKTLVSTMNNLNCTAFNDRQQSAMMNEPPEFGDGIIAHGDMPYDSARKHSQQRTPSTSRGRSTSSASRSKASRSFRQYSKSPQRADI